MPFPQALNHSFLFVFSTQADQGQLRRVLHGLLDLPGLLQPGRAATLPPAAAGLRQLRAGQAGLGEAAAGRPVQGEGCEGESCTHLHLKHSGRIKAEAAEPTRKVKSGCDRFLGSEP